MIFDEMRDGVITLYNVDVDEDSPDGRKLKSLGWTFDREPVTDDYRWALYL